MALPQAEDYPGAMSRLEAPIAPEPTAARSWSLLLATLAMALLGLTLVDAAPLASAELAGLDPGAADCVVASAVFSGVAAAPPMR